MRGVTRQRFLRAQSPSWVSYEQWKEICTYLKSQRIFIRVSMCEGCGKARLFDATGKVYQISASGDTMETVKQKVETVKKINASIN